MAYQKWGDHFGFNCFVWDIPELMFSNPVTRVYTNWEFLVDKDGDDFWSGATLSPTWQNFKYDDFLSAVKLKGGTVILDLKESFAKRYGTDKWDTPVIPPGSPKNNVHSYAFISQIAFNIAARWGKNDNVPNSDIHIHQHPVSWARPPRNTNFIITQKVKKGLDLVDIIEIGNEEDRWWSLNFTPEEYAHYLSACYDGHKGELGPGHGIINADPDMALSFNGLVGQGVSDNGAGIQYLKDTIQWWEQIRGEPFPHYNSETKRGIMFSYHEYQAGPSEKEEGFWLGMDEWDDYCKEVDNYYWMGEYGESTVVKGNPWDDKYVVTQYKKLDGSNYTLEESGGAEIVKTSLMYFRKPRLLYNVFYEFRDQNVQVFNDMGVVKRDDNSKKDGYFVVEGFHELMKDYSFSKDISKDDPYIFELENGDSKAYVMWVTDQHSANHTLDIQGASSATFTTLSKDGSDIQNIPVGDGNINVQIGNMPSILITDGVIDSGTTPVITGTTDMKHLKVLNGKLAWADTDETLIIAEANSPETRLFDLHYPELAEIYGYGVNTLYFTTYGEDGNKHTHPWKAGYNNTSQGFDDAKIASWVAYAEAWVNLHPEGRNVCHILLGESENHGDLSEVDRKAQITKMVEAFGHLPVIWDYEELWTSNGSSTNFIKYFEHLRQEDPNNIIATHNSTSDKPWLGQAFLNAVDMFSIQHYVQLFDNHISQMPAGKPFYNSEMNGGFQTGDLAKVDQWFNNGGGKSSGAGIFIANKDQAFPNFQSQYKSLYERLAELAGNATPPPPNNGPVTFHEQSGLVVMESDSVPVAEGWTMKTDNPGYTGIAYIEWTGQNNFNNPAQGTMEYMIVITKTGRYQLHVRNWAPFGTGTGDENDFWFTSDQLDTSNLDGGNQGWFKVYNNTPDSWGWQTTNFDNSPRPLFLDFDSPGTYIVKISGRSNRHSIDRIVLRHDDVGVTAATTALPPESPKDGGTPGGNPIPGCTDVNATNYNPAATYNDGSCLYDAGDMEIHISDFPNMTSAQNLDGQNIEANKNVYIFVFGNAVAPVNMKFDGALIRTENVPPFTLAGDSGGQANPYVFAYDGQHSVTAEHNGTVIASATFTVGEVSPPIIISGCTDSEATNYNPNATFDDGTCEYPEPPVVVSGCTDPNATNYNPDATFDDGTCDYPEPPAAPEVVRLVLINAQDDVDLFDLTDNITINRTETDLTAVSARAEANEKTASVKFGLDGNANYQNENVQPFSLHGDAAGNYHKVDLSALGEHTITVTPYSNSGQAGDVGEMLMVNFTVIDGEPEPILGCTDSEATNYNPDATIDDGSCEYPEPPAISGCTDSEATNYNPDATIDDGSCEYPEPEPILGCMDSNATNYNPNATIDDGTCEYPEPTTPSYTIEGGEFSVLLDGEIHVEGLASIAAATTVAANLKFANPDSDVVITMNDIIISL